MCVWKRCKRYSGPDETVPTVLEAGTKAQEANTNRQAGNGCTRKRFLLLRARTGLGKTTASHPFQLNKQAKKNDKLSFLPVRGCVYGLLEFRGALELPTCTVLPFHRRLASRLTWMAIDSIRTNQRALHWA